MKADRNMLVETVFEQHGERIEPISNSEEYTGPDGCICEEILYRKVPNLIPVGVMVGMNDNGVIRVGWSRCKLPPAISKAPMVIPEEYLEHMDAEGIEKYYKEQHAYDQAVLNSDTFNMDQGIAQACTRMLVYAELPKGRNFGGKFKAFTERCCRYFKDVRYLAEYDKNRHCFTKIPNPKYISPLATIHAQHVAANIVANSRFNEEMCKKYNMKHEDPVKELLNYLNFNRIKL